MDTVPDRPLPGINEMNDYFWQGGADGHLHILRCQGCRHWIHPYTARCPQCRSPDVKPEAVSGSAFVVGFTVNHQPWQPDVPVPYVVAIVALDEQGDLRLMTNLPRVPIEAVCIGLHVKVYFEPHERGIFLPLFEKA